MSNDTQLAIDMMAKLHAKFEELGEVYLLSMLTDAKFNGVEFIISNGTGDKYLGSRFYDGDPIDVNGELGIKFEGRSEAGGSGCVVDLYVGWDGTVEIMLIDNYERWGYCDNTYPIAKENINSWALQGIENLEFLDNWMSAKHSSQQF